MRARPRVCPICGYDLSATPAHPELDGHLTCSECGALLHTHDADPRHPARPLTVRRWFEQDPRGTLMGLFWCVLGVVAVVGIMLAMEMAVE